MLNFLHAAYVFQLFHNISDIFSVMDAEFYQSVEDALLTSKDDLVDVDAELPRNDLCNFVDQTDAVDASHLDGCREEELLVHSPLHVENAVAET